MEKKRNSHLQNETIESRILIVDDNKDFVLSLVDILEPLGYVVETAYNTKDACKKLQDFDTHLALIDIRLGHTNGINLIHEFKSAMPDILCVMMTAYADIDASIRALKEGAYDYLQKPMETHGLLATIDRCFETIQLGVEKSAAEKALRESESRFRTLAGNIPGVLFRCEMDDNWTMLYINDMIKVVSGYPATDFIVNSNRSFASIIHPDDREMVRDVVHKAVKQRESFSVEYRITDTDESVKWIFGRGQGVFAENGKVQFLDGVLFDITERKRAEEALQSLATTFSTIIGEEFFNKVSAHLATTLDMDYAFIGELIEKKDRVKVLGGFGKGQRVEPFEYDLADTPCENVMGRSLFYYPRGVSEQFPKDLLLVEMGIEGYIGTPLFDKSGKALGIMAVLNCKPITSPKITENLFNIFDHRVSAEIERRQAEEFLRESEEKYRSLFDTAGDSIFITKITDGFNPIFVDCNKHTLEIFGCSREEIIGKSPEDFSPSTQPDGRLSHEIIVERVKATLDGKPQFVEFTHRKLDGTLFDTEVKLNRIDIGKETYLQAIIRDVTVRKRAEKKVASLARVLEESLNEVYIFDANTLKFVQVNKGARANLGYSIEELRDFTPLNIKPEFTQKSFEKQIEPLRSGEKGMIMFETVHQRKDGSLYDVEVHLQLYTFESSPVFVAIILDITERKRADEALRKSETKFRRLSQEFHTLLDAIDDPMIQISPELKILWANHSAVTFSGKDISSLQGQYCYKLWFNRSDPCNNCPTIEKCFQTGEAGSIQVSTPDGRFCNLKASPVKDEKGKVHNVIEIYSDITKEMIMQEESTRAAQLAALGELAASVAHEINNPVYGITMCAQSLLAEGSNGKIKDHDIVKMILKESGRIANVTRCLLSFVRDSEETKSLCNINELLSDTLTITGVIISKEGIALRLQIPKDLPEILAYPQRIQQVFLNIINNARYTLNEKYPDTHKNKIIEIIGKKIMIDDCPYNQITFHDRGMGIAADKIEKALNPFFTTKPRGKGTGLGLSISNKIIKNHGGKIDIDSIEGKFTKFIISLPAAE